MDFWYLMIHFFTLEPKLLYNGLYYVRDRCVLYTPHPPLNILIEDFNQKTTNFMFEILKKKRLSEGTSHGPTSHLQKFVYSGS